MESSPENGSMSLSDTVLMLSELLPPLGFSALSLEEDGVRLFRLITTWTPLGSVSALVLSTAPLLWTPESVSVWVSLCLSVAVTLVSPVTLLDELALLVVWDVDVGRPDEVGLLDETVDEVDVEVPDDVMTDDEEVDVVTGQVWGEDVVGLPSSGSCAPSVLTSGSGLDRVSSD